MLLLIRGFAIFSQLANIADDHLVRREAPGRAQPAGAGARRASTCRPDARRLPDGGGADAGDHRPPHRGAAQEHPRPRDRHRRPAGRRRGRGAPTSDVEIEAALKREIRTLWQTRMLRSVRINVSRRDRQRRVDLRAAPSCRRFPALKRRLARAVRRGGAAARLLAGRLLGRRRPRRQSLRRRPDPGLRPDPPGRGGDRLAICEQLHALGAELSLSDDFTGVSDGLRALADAGGDANPQREDEPYRRALVGCYARLAATRTAILGRGPARPAARRGRALRRRPSELRRRPRRSSPTPCEANGAADLAQGRLLDVREAVASFGFHLAVIDLRQNSDVHERVVAELLAQAGVGRGLPAALSEAGASQLLLAPSWPARACCARPTATMRDETARASWPSSTPPPGCAAASATGAIANYVISKAASVSDMLEVAILLKEAGLFTPGEHAAPAPCASCRCSRPSTTCAPAPRSWPPGSTCRSPAPSSPARAACRK